jgi:hypothetical protein
MIFIKGFSVPPRIIEQWSERFSPAFDLFYFKDQPDFIHTCEIAELSKDIFTLDVRTAFLTWSIDNKAKFVSCMPNDVFRALPSDSKRKIIFEQKEVNRGLIFAVDEFKDLLKGTDLESQKKSLDILLRESHNEEVLAIQGYSWRLLSEKVRKTILLNYADDWVDEHSLGSNKKELYKEPFSILYPYFDSFPGQNGPNCFAAVIAAITNNENYISEWMQPDIFLNILKEYDYHLTNTPEHELDSNDVLVWYNSQDMPVHAAFMLDHNHAFNKHGQTMYNPWQIIRINDLKESWNTFRISIFRGSDK